MEIKIKMKDGPTKHYGTKSGELKYKSGKGLVAMFEEGNAIGVSEWEIEKILIIP